MDILKMILATAVIVVAIYSFLNQDLNLSSIMLLVVGVYFLIVGAEQIKKGKKPVGFIYTLIALFNLYVSLQHFLHV